MTNLVKLDSLRIDIKAETDGTWQTTQWSGVRVRVRSIHYRPYCDARDEQRERLATQYLNQKIPDAVWTPILGGLLATHILLEWDGLSPAYDTDAADEVLRAEDGRLLREAVILAASRVGIRDLEFVAQLEKNSAAPSVIN